MFSRLLNNVRFAKSLMPNTRSCISPTRHIHATKFSLTSTETHTEADRIYDDDEKEMRRLILDAAILNVSMLGWTDDSIAKAINDVGKLNGPLAHGIFTRGAYDLLEHFLEKKRAHVFALVNQQKETTESTDFHDTSSLSSEEKYLIAGMEAHFEYLSPYLSSWPSALAVLADPRYALDTVKIVGSTVDDLCFLAGMQSSRGDWYKERLLVLSIYTSSELFLLTDHSSNFEETRAFIRRNISYQRILYNIGSRNSTDGFQSVVTSIFSKFYK
mmetsp:Transcript_28084/g.40005  ORF Transcript_28084/g.40005 Transcript_28084/m.40005 type:complete len:272 (+) Transcript_28084:31-846(+)